MTPPPQVQPSPQSPVSDAAAIVALTRELSSMRRTLEEQKKATSFLEAENKSLTKSLEHHKVLEGGTYIRP